MTEGATGSLDQKTQRLFLVLILIQMAHSIEEYVFELWEHLAVPRIISEALASLLGTDVATGFAIGNAAFIILGLWCAVVPIRNNWPAARGLAIALATIEIANGILHLTLAAINGGYFPGAVTAPLLLVTGVLLGLRMRGSA